MLAALTAKSDGICYRHVAYLQIPPGSSELAGLVCLPNFEITESSPKLFERRKRLMSDRNRQQLTEWDVVKVVFSVLGALAAIVAVVVQTLH